MRIALVHAGPEWGTGDVATGLADGLAAQGIDVVRWAVDEALADRPDAVILVTAIRHDAEAVRRLIAMGIPVTALFTESPYEMAAEVAMAATVAGCWTHERTAVEAFRAVNPRVSYLPHAWHPAIHTPTPQPGDDALPAHDVVFVGAGVRERIAFFNAIDWTGIDLGLYGIWEDLGLKDSIVGCIKSGPIDNRTAAALYRRAKIGLNLYRRLRPIGPDRPTLQSLGPDRPDNWVTAESLNPRAYELAACGCFQLTGARAEHLDVFGSTLGTFDEANRINPHIRWWLDHLPLRATLAEQARRDVQGCSWVERAAQILNDLTTWGVIEKASWPTVA